MPSHSESSLQAPRPWEPGWYEWMYQHDPMFHASVDLTTQRIARWLEWRSGAYLYREDETRNPIPRHPNASASGWGEAGMQRAAREIREGQWADEPEGGW